MVLLAGRFGLIRATGCRRRVTLRAVWSRVKPGHSARYERVAGKPSLDGGPEGWNISAAARGTAVPPGWVQSWPGVRGGVPPSCAVVAAAAVLSASRGGWWAAAVPSRRLRRRAVTATAVPAVPTAQYPATR